LVLLIFGWEIHYSWSGSNDMDLWNKSIGESSKATDIWKLQQTNCGTSDEFSSVIHFYVLTQQL
jgi:hypothetical protein